MDYSQRIMNRIEVLEQKSLNAREAIKHTKRDATRMRGSLEAELVGLQEECAQLEEEIQVLKRRILLVVQQFQNVIKKGDFDRLKRRADAFAPEQKVSRREFLELIAKQKRPSADTPSE